MRVANVLFLCIGNAGRSQMAHAFLEAHGGHEVRPAGSRAETRLHPEVVEVMREIGFDRTGPNARLGPRGLCLNSLMTAQVEELGGDTVRLKVDVPAHDVHHAVEHATSDLAESVKIPGFRPRKDPIPVLKQRLGNERIYREAVDSHIGGWFWNAAARARIRPVAQPQYDYELPTGDDADWQFTATVPVQPRVDVVDWTELEVGRPEAEVPEELVEQELERLRDSVAELVPAGDRPAREGDTLVVDIVSPEGETQRDTVVELGSGRLVDEVEQALLGASAGETKTVSYELADETASSVEVTVKEVSEK